MDDKKRESLIRYSSLVFLVWTAIYLYNFIMALFVAFSTNALKQGLFYLATLLFILVIYSVITVGLRKLLIWAGYFSLFFSGLNFLLGVLLIQHNLLALFPLVTGALAFVLTILGWKALK